MLARAAAVYSWWGWPLIVVMSVLLGAMLVPSVNGSLEALLRSGAAECRGRGTTAQDCFDDLLREAGCTVITGEEVPAIAGLAGMTTETASTFRNCAASSGLFPQPWQLAGLGAFLWTLSSAGRTRRAALIAGVIAALEIGVFTIMISLSPQIAVFSWGIPIGGLPRGTPCCSGLPGSIYVVPHDIKILGYAIVAALWLGSLIIFLTLLVRWSPDPKLGNTG